MADAPTEAAGGRYRLHGGMGSPYSLKMRALLRYRRIPHDWVLIGRDSPIRSRHGGANVIPVLEYPDGSARVDSTPLALDLEARHSARQVLPEEPVARFLALLLEDFADEWLTKVMFHYRWYREVDRDYSAAQIVADNSVGLEGAAFDAAVRAIRARQVSRMPIVGCTLENSPVIEETFYRLLDALEHITTRDRFLFGSRPSLADFAVYGQCRVLSEDHTPQSILRTRNPRVYDWLRRLDDASGIEGQWRELGESPNAATRALLDIVADCHLPFLDANERALRDSVESLAVQIRGIHYVQAPFRYQSKCLDALRVQARLLTPSQWDSVIALLGPVANVLRVHA